jgi:hypothetical protein
LSLDEEFDTIEERLTKLEAEVKGRKTLFEQSLREQEKTLRAELVEVALRC